MMNSEHRKMGLAMTRLQRNHG